MICNNLSINRFWIIHCLSFNSLLSISYPRFMRSCFFSTSSCVLLMRLWYFLPNRLSTINKKIASQPWAVNSLSNNRLCVISCPWHLFYHPTIRFPFVIQLIFDGPWDHVSFLSICNCFPSVSCNSLSNNRLCIVNCPWHPTIGYL